MHPYFFQTTQTRAKFRDMMKEQNQEHTDIREPHSDFLVHWTKQTNAGSLSYRDACFGDISSIKTLPDRPISFLGASSILSLPLLAILGPRQADSYATKGVKRVLDHAKQYKLATISGLAEGVDTECALGSIERGIPTIAVLGGGLYRGRHDPRIGPLMRRIIDHGGCILSEYPLQMRPTSYTFPQRNRVIILCCHVVFVPYAGVKSGTMLSIGYARDFGKPVYALPTPFDFDPGNGSSLLIQQHQITAVVDADYFLAKHFVSVQTDSQIRSYHPQTKTIPSLSDPHQAAIIKLLHTTDTMDASLLARDCCDGDFGACITALTMLEIEGYIHQPRPGVYALVSTS